MAERSRQLPTAPEAEVAVLGALLIDAGAADEAFGTVSALDFRDKRHQVICRAMEDLSRAGDPIDPVAVGEALTASGEIDAAGGYPYVGDLLDAVPSATNVAYHAGIVRDRAVRRRLYDAAQQTADEVLADDGDLATLLDRAEQRVFSVAEGMATTGPVQIRDALWPAMQLIERGQEKGVPTGFTDLDRMTGGLRPGNLVLLAARPSMGKSALGVQIAVHAAVREAKNVALFSIEMTQDENVLRILAAEGLLDLQALFQGRVPDDELPRLHQASAAVHKAPLWIDDTATRVVEIRSRSRRIAAEHGLDLVVVDHIHVMSEDAEDRRNEVSKIGRGLKQLAKELAVPVLAMAQLSRKPDERGDKRPMLSDLRESGGLEEDADMVWLLYRPEHYFGPKDAKGNDITGKAEAIIAKQRNGPTGTVPLYFRATSARFEDRAEDWKVKHAS